MSATGAVPALRFPEFEGEWSDKKLSDVARVFDGTHQTPNYVAEGVPFISVENIADLKATNKYISEASFKRDFKTIPQKGDVMMTRITAGIIGATAVVQDDEPLAYYVSLALIRVKDSINPNFLAQRIESNGFKRELHKRIIHVAFPKKINLGDLGDCRAILPSFPEQKKIAAFLGVVDAKIAALRDRVAGLERYKRGLMQALFSQSLRFTKPDGTPFPDWEEKRLGEVLHEHKAKSTGNEEVFSVSVHRGLVNQIEHLGRSFSAANTDDYNRVKPNDIVYTKSPTGDFPLGIIKQSHVEKDVIVSPLYGVFTPETPALGLILHVHFESNVNVSNYLSPIVQKGAKNTINVTNKGFLSNKLTLPVDTDEQATIAGALSAMDAKIAAVTGQLEKMQDFKKGLLQQMFV